MRVIFIFLLFFSFSATAQLQVIDTSAIKSGTIGKIKGKAELNYYVTNDDTIYSLMFQNAKYQSISDYQSIEFNGGKEVLDQLYSIIKTFFTEENKKNKDYKQQFMLGKKDVIISNYRLMGVTNAMVWCDDGYFYLTEKETDKLFNP